METLFLVQHFHSVIKVEREFYSFLEVLLFQTEVEKISFKTSLET